MTQKTTFNNIKLYFVAENCTLLQKTVFCYRKLHYVAEILSCFSFDYLDHIAFIRLLVKMQRYVFLVPNWWIKTEAPTNAAVYVLFLSFFCVGTIQINAI